MKIVLAAINSKYVHTSLSVRCIRESVKDICDCVATEYTINDNIDKISEDIYVKKPDCVAFSCYIWNIDTVYKVASVLKKTNPDILIALGGHEVQYDAKNVLKNNACINAVIHGEGEISFKNYIKALTDGKSLSSVGAITYRNGTDIITNPNTYEPLDLNMLPFVYTDEEIEEIKNKIIYYESSRGCPYSCTYCISGENSKVRFLDTERVKKELKFFMSHSVPLVKFVDRTFNANPSRAREIFEFIADNPSETCFHMELSGDLIDDKTLAVLRRVPKGTLQFEIGVQTTNIETLFAISRRVSYEKLCHAVTKLLEFDNIHIHLDLIAGLPYEDLNSFKNSFDDVINLKPHMLQLGFLKLLKGSKIRTEEEKYGFIYHDFPPYEIISNDFLSFDNILELKRVEFVLDRYYNSGNFVNSLDILFKKYKSKYNIFLELANYVWDKYPSGYAFSLKALYDIMYECFENEGSVFTEALKKDYLMHIRPGKRPAWLGNWDKSLMDIAYEIFKDEDYKREHMPFYYDIPAKEIMKNIHAEKFSYGILLFDYKRNEIYYI
jgi:radical SAM superfamily enzyme YgiQ (UPF0313 family)